MDSLEPPHARALCIGFGEGIGLPDRRFLQWETRECNATNEHGTWTERVETWYRVDTVDGQQILRPHRREVSSEFEHRRVDYMYVMSGRLHTSLFDSSFP